MAEKPVVGEPAPVGPQLTRQVVDVDRLPVEVEGDGDVGLEGLTVGKSVSGVANSKQDPLAGRGLKGQGPRQVGSTEMRKCAFVGAAAGLGGQSHVRR